MNIDYEIIRRELGELMVKDPSVYSAFRLGENKDLTPTDMLIGMVKMLAAEKKTYQDLYKQLLTVSIKGAD